MKGLRRRRFSFSFSLSFLGWHEVVLAILLAEAADTEVFQRLRDRGWYQRVAGSNAISIPLDSLIFTLVAFAGVFSAYTIAEIVWGDIVAKGIVGAAVALRLGRLGRSP